MLELNTTTKNGKIYNRGAYRIIDPSKPAPTITSGVHYLESSTCAIHYSKNRPLTPEECGRAQTFPIGCRFIGSIHEVYQQIGNAVPPYFSYLFGCSILNSSSIEDVFSFAGYNKKLDIINPVSSLSVESASILNAEKLWEIINQKNKENNIPQKDVTIFIGSLVKEFLSNNKLYKKNILNNYKERQKRHHSTVIALKEVGILEEGTDEKDDFYILKNEALFMEMFTSIPNFLKKKTIREKYLSDIKEICGKPGGVSQISNELRLKAGVLHEKIS